MLGGKSAGAAFGAAAAGGAAGAGAGDAASPDGAAGGAAAGVGGLWKKKLTVSANQSAPSEPPRASTAAAVMRYAWQQLGVPCAEVMDC